MGKDTKNKLVKSAYEKPQLNIIELAAEEVLAVGCKTFSGPSNVGGAACGIFRRCSTRGS